MVILCIWHHTARTVPALGLWHCIPCCCAFIVECWDSGLCPRLLCHVGHCLSQGPRPLSLSLFHQPLRREPMLLLRLVQNFPTVSQSRFVLRLLQRDALSHEAREGLHVLRLRQGPCGQASVTRQIREQLKGTLTLPAAERVGLRVLLRVVGQAPQVHEPKPAYPALVRVARPAGFIFLIGFGRVRPEVCLQARHRLVSDPAPETLESRLVRVLVQVGGEAEHVVLADAAEDAPESLGPLAPAVCSRCSFLRREGRSLFSWAARPRVGLCAGDPLPLPGDRRVFGHVALHALHRPERDVTPAAGDDVAEFIRCPFHSAATRGRVLPGL